MAKVTLKDIVDGTLAGQKAVEKAVEQSIKDQEELSAKAKALRSAPKPKKGEK